MNLPPGFQLESAPANQVKLPPGFQLELVDQIPGAQPQQVQAAATAGRELLQPKPEIGRQAVELARPTVEALGAAGGAALGTPLGPAGIVGGAGLGYGISKGALDMLEQLMGYRAAPSSARESLLGGAKDVLTGMTFEAGGRAAAPLITAGLEKFGRAATRALDVRGRQATTIARAAAGDEIDAIRAALRNAAPDETPAQATAEIPRKVWQSLNELGTSTDKADQILKTQTDELLGDLSRLARGGNETEIRNALDASRQMLNAVTSPMRQTELKAANQAAETIAKLAPRAEQKQASLVSALQETGRMQTEAAQRGVAAREQFARIPEEGGIPSVSARQAGRTQEAMARQFQGTADDFAAVRTQRREELDFINRQMGSLEQYGLRPLNIDNMLGSIEKSMTTPGRRVSATQTQVLGKVKDQLERAAAMNNGVIDARDLYTIRKEGVNEIIDSLMTGRDPRVSKKVAADVLGIVRPAIDDAIEAAGGTGWRNYLKTFEQGAKDLEKRQMAADALRLFKDSPDQYVKLVRGENTAAVESVFGTGNFDIFKEMAKEMPTLNKVASYVERQGVIANKAKGGREDLLKLIDQNSWRRRLPNWFNPTITTINLALRDVEKRINDDTLKLIREATLSNKSMLELLEGLPPSERGKLMRLITNANTWIKTPGARTGVIAGMASDTEEQ